MTARRAKLGEAVDIPAVPARSGVRPLLDSADTVDPALLETRWRYSDAVFDAEVVRTADEWAEVIKADLSSAVEGFVAAGRHLARAKADVRQGDWLPTLKQIGASQGYPPKPSPTMPWTIRTSSTASASSASFTGGGD